MYITKSKLYIINKGKARAEVSFVAFSEYKGRQAQIDERRKK